MLQLYSGTLLLISHDKSFFRRTINEIISVSKQKLVSYTGNYDAYETQRSGRFTFAKPADIKANKIKFPLRILINRFGAKAVKASRRKVE